MSKRVCGKCGNTWPGEDLPFCPACMAYDWEHIGGFIRPKHDPSLLPLPLPVKRSVVTMDFITNESLYINEISHDGTYYYDTVYNNFTCVHYQSLGTTAGSAIPRNFPLPTYPLDSQIVVDVFGNAHVYAVDSKVITFEIAQGRLVPAGKCSVRRCNNRAIPGTTKCGMH